MTSKEVWKICEDYPELSVSNYGRVRKGKTILKQTQEPQGYLRITSINPPIRVHRLVAKAFLPTIPGKTQIDHINNIKTDNRACNLRYVTSRENTIKAGECGMLSRNRRNIPIVAVNMSTLETYHFNSQAEAGIELEIDPKSISACLKKRRLITANHKFYYETEWAEL